MSKKHITEAVENMNDLPADLGPMMKALGTVLTDEFQKRNGIFANKEERSQRKNEPLAEVETSDIQVRFGNRLITLMPAVEGKPMISIPVGSSDKATPATIPREWMIGTMIQSLKANPMWSGSMSATSIKQSTTPPIPMKKVG